MPWGLPNPFDLFGDAIGSIAGIGNVFRNGAGKLVNGAGNLVTGTLNGVYYVGGVVANGTFGGVRYVGGRLANGTFGGMRYVAGKVVNKAGDMLGTGTDVFWSAGGTLVDAAGNAANGTMNGVRYVGGKVFTGVSNGVRYVNGLPVFGPNVPAPPVAGTATPIPDPVSVPETPTAPSGGGGTVKPTLGADGEAALRAIDNSAIRNEIWRRFSLSFRRVNGKWEPGPYGTQLNAVDVATIHAQVNRDLKNFGGGGNPPSAGIGGGSSGDGGGSGGTGNGGGSQPAPTTTWNQVDAAITASGNGPFIRAYVTNMFRGGFWPNATPQEMIARAVQVRDHIDAQKPDLKDKLRGAVMAADGNDNVASVVGNILDAAGMPGVPPSDKANTTSWYLVENALKAGGHGPFIVEYVRSMYIRGQWTQATADQMVTRAVQIRNHIDSQPPELRDAIRNAVINQGGSVNEVTKLLADAGAPPVPPAGVSGGGTGDGGGAGAYNPTVTDPPKPTVPKPVTGGGGTPTKPATREPVSADSLRKAYGDAIAQAAAGNTKPLKDLDARLGITRPQAEYSADFYKTPAMAALTAAQSAGITQNFGPAAQLPPPSVVSWGQVDAALTAQGYGPYVRTYIKNMYDKGLWKTSSAQEMINRTVQIRDFINTQPQPTRDAIWNKIMNSGGTVTEVSQMLSNAGLPQIPPPVKVSWAQVDATLRAQGQGQFVRSYVQNMYQKGLWSTSSAEEMIVRAEQIRDHVDKLPQELRESIRYTVEMGGGTVNEVTKLLAQAGIDNNNDGLTTQAEFTADGKQNAWLQYSETARVSGGGLDKKEWEDLVRHRTAIGMYDSNGNKGYLGKAIDSLMGSDPTKHNRVWTTSEVEAKLKARGFNIVLPDSVKKDGNVSEQELADFIYVNSKGTTAQFKYKDGVLAKASGVSIVENAIAKLAAAGADVGTSTQQKDTLANANVAASARSLHNNPQGGALIDPKSGGLSSDPNIGNIASYPSMPKFTD